MRHHRTAAAALAAGFVLALPAAAAAAAPAQDSTLSAQDKAFLVAAHQSNLTEIAAGKAAQQKATNTAVREHGATFIRDHTTLDASLTKLASSLGVALPGSPSPAQQQVLASVGAKSGAAFDTAWVSTQITGHRQAQAAGDKEIAYGSNTKVIALAKTAAPVVASHLSMLLSTAPAVGVNAGGGGSATGSSAPWAYVLGGAALAGAGGLGLRRKVAAR